MLGIAESRSTAMSRHWRKFVIRSAKSCSPSRNAAIPACWTNAVGPAMLNSESAANGASRAGGATTQPSRQPVIDQVFENELIEITRSFSSVSAIRNGAPVARIDDARIDIVADQPDSARTAERQKGGGTAFVDHPAGRVAGAVDADGAGLRAAGGEQRIEIEIPAVLVGRQCDLADHPAHHARRTGHVGPGRHDDDHLVARIDDRLQHQHDALHARRGDGDAFARKPDTVDVPGVVADHFAQFRQPAVGQVEQRGFRPARGRRRP